MLNKIPHQSDPLQVTSPHPCKTNWFIIKTWYLLGLAPDSQAKVAHVFIWSLSCRGWNVVPGFPEPSGTGTRIFKNRIPGSSSIILIRYELGGDCLEGAVFMCSVITHQLPQYFLPWFQHWLVPFTVPLTRFRFDERILDSSAYGILRMLWN